MVASKCIIILNFSLAKVLIPSKQLKRGPDGVDRDMPTLSPVLVTLRSTPLFAVS